jgi:hypothetical protein
VPQMRCENCRCVFEAEDNDGLIDAINDHISMHRLEEPVPSCLLFVILPHEEFAITIEL